jgi:hypothetical protein
MIATFGGARKDVRVRVCEEEMCEEGYKAMLLHLESRGVAESFHLDLRAE